MTVGEGKPSAGIACLPHLCVVGAVPRVCYHLLNICLTTSIYASQPRVSTTRLNHVSTTSQLRVSTTRLNYASASLHMSRREQHTI
jgi:hypothetical protein